MPTLAQTLHGYDRGHHLLASSGEPNERELALLERLSDLSGYLPRDTSYTHYHTGFPCGRFYALACTWPDVAATRAGTVLTHTLLLPLEQARELEDLWALASLHRRPASADDRDSYRKPLALPALPSPTEPLSLSEAERQALVALLLGTKADDRPLLWVDEQPPTSAVRFLWSLLGPWQRERFAFCTFALQPRSVEGRSFDFFGLPPTARGSFLDRAGSEAWWDKGRFLSPRIASLTQQPWVQELARQGTPALRRLELWCRDNQLDFPTSHVHMLWRLLELEPAAAERLPAARSWADLLERLWPQLEPQHPTADKALRQLLARLPEAPVQPRPLFELTDFLQRPLTRRRLNMDASFTSEVEALSARELKARFERNPEATLQELPGLIDALPRGKEKSYAVLEEVVASTPEAAVRVSPILLLKAAREDLLAMARIALAPLPTRERLRALDECLQRLNAPALSTATANTPAPAPTDAETQLLLVVENAAEHLQDTELHFQVSLRRKGPLYALLNISRLLNTLKARPVEPALSPFLARVDAEARLAWALQQSESSLEVLAADTGAKAAAQMGLSPEELVRRCAQASRRNGLRTLLASAASMQQWEALTPHLRASPVFATELLAHVLELPSNWDTDKLTRVAFSVVPPEMLLQPDLRRVLLNLPSRESGRLREPTEKLGPQWVRASIEGSLSADALSSWLELASLRQWLRDVSMLTLLSATPPNHRSRALPALVVPLNHWLRTSPNAHDKAWMVNFLERLLREASPQALDEAAESLASLLRALAHTYDIEYLAAKVLTAVFRSPSQNGWHLVEATFPRFYAKALRKEPSLGSLLWAFFTGKQEDDAKPLRKWLVDTYVSRRWPLDSFLRCLNGDTQLFSKLASRAARTAEGRDFLRQFPAALEADPALASSWRGAVENVLSNLERLRDDD